MTDHAPAGSCRNCGSPAPGAYCPSCGQETALHPPSAKEFLHEFAGHYVALEGALWRTLRTLLVPGKLTLEYFAGRRRQYVLPLRLYLTASLLFFLVVKVVAPHAEFRVVTLGEGTAAAAQSTPRGGIAITCKADAVPCIKLRARLEQRYGALSQAQLGALVRDKLVAYSPYAMFLLLPIFAFLTRVAYWRRPRNYGEHLVFALHVHSFAFFVGSLAAIAGLIMIETIAAAIYLAVALGAVFGGRWWTHMLRFVLVFVAYFVLILLAVGIIATGALFL